MQLQATALAINYVIFEKDKNVWHNNGGKDYSVRLFYPVKDPNAPEIPEFVEQIIQCETTYNSWTLMHRFNKCYDLLNCININDENNVAWIYIWLKYSNLRQLTWQKNYNTKPREVSSSQLRLTELMTRKFIDLSNNNKNNSSDFWKPDIIVRMLLSLLGKGANEGDGQRVRDDILKIQQKNHMHGNFYEQWHQKLHNNSTPDDIIICEAVLNFLKNGGKSKNDYWSVLNKNGITSERLASFERKISKFSTFN